MVVGGAAAKAAPAIASTIGKGASIAGKGALSAGKLGFQGLKGGLGKVAGLTKETGLGTSGIGPFKDAVTYANAIETGVSPTSAGSVLKGAGSNAINFLNSPAASNIQSMLGGSQQQSQPMSAPPSASGIQPIQQPQQDITNAPINPWPNFNPVSRNQNSLNNNPWGGFNGRY